MSEELKGLLEKNLEMSKEILVVSKQVRRTLRLQAVFSWIKFLIIVVPVALAIYFAPRLLNQYLGNVSGLLNGKLAPQDILKSLNINLSDPQLREILNSASKGTR